MRFNIKKLAAATALGLVTILGTSEIANAQGNRNKDRRDDQKQQKKAGKQNSKIAKERSRAEEHRQDEWARRNQRVQNDQRRQDEWARRSQVQKDQHRQDEWARQNQRIQNDQRRNDDRDRRITRSGNDRSNGNGYYNGNANANTSRNNRYRVYRNGSYYNTDQRGADLLRQAVNAGYQQGFQAARNDLNNRRRASYSNSNVYKSGSYGYQTHVNRSQYQYYFRQGFQRGYQDGSNTRYQNNYQGQQYEYGYNNNGSMSILGAILSQILNIQTY